ncbi:SseB family protein [Streptomyces sp. NPDC127114]|uniref:SseB family protein n=1 Tax=Streptomyces sp. NPDC127114 TaxID=3345366 RepID=UPI0036411F5B
MSLRDLLRDETLATMSRAERLEAMLSARLYFQRPDEPGFFVRETEEGPVVPVFTSCAALGLFAGPCGWASTTVADLVELLPEGVRALVDPLGPRTYVLDAKVLETTVEQGEHDGGGRGTPGLEPR